MNLSRLRQVLFIVGDIVSLLLGFLLVFSLRKRTPFFPPLQEFSFYFSFIWLYIASFSGFFLAFRLYDGRRPQLSLSYLLDYVKALLSWGVIIIGFAFVAQADYSRVLLLYSLVPGVIFPFVLRLFIVWLLPQKVEHSDDEEISRKAYKLIDLNKLSLDELDQLEGLSSERTDSLAYVILKRLLDVGVSLVGLALLALLFPLIAIFIKRDSSGPILISQERVGLNNRRFIFYKFRTMKKDTPLYAVAPRNGNDDRVTKSGRLLRKYSLDELPQLWNVLRGDMSIVGPRPEMPFLIAQYNDWQKKRLTVKPGITGLWQILGRKDLPLSDNLEYDFYYINHRSFLLDIVIILKTVPVIILGRGAY